MKKLLVFSLLLAGIVLLTALVQQNQRSVPLLTLRVGGSQLQVEVADTPEKITLGLGERDSLGSDGMLFVMPARSIPSFWMKGMRFDLDFVWIDDGRVIDLTERVKAEPNVPTTSLRLYSPSGPVTHVLELPAGDIARRGIKLGDEIVY